MPYKQFIFRAFLGAALLSTSVASDAMTYYKNNGVLKLSGKANADDRTKLKEQLTPDVHTIILIDPDEASWGLSRDLAEIVENAQVTTVVQGWCDGLICPALFLAGKQRMFSSVTRPEASFISLGVSTEGFPSISEDRGRSWTDVISWWREHTKLSRTELWPRHPYTVRPGGILRAEHLKFFHPSARTSKGSAIECFGEKQDFLSCIPMADNKDALSAGIITTLNLYVPADKTNIMKDIEPPAPSTFAKLEDVPLKIEKLNDKCNETYADFLRHDAPRAFVVSSNGGCYFSYALQYTPYSSALQKCQKATKSDCQFYAVDNAVVFTGFKSAL